MKKSKKIAIIIVIILILIFLCVGIVLKKIPLPFIDNKNTECIVESSASDDLSIESKILVEYNFLGKVTSAFEINLYKFNISKTNEEINTYTNGVLGMIENKPKEIKKTSNTIELIFDLKENKLKGKNKKQVNQFIEETGYECIKK